jgi:glycosyltransferase involved in cell wall biosynthesis
MGETFSVSGSREDGPPKGIAERLSCEPASPMTVAYLLPRLEMGGTEKHVRDLVARLDRRKFRPIVIATSDGGVLEADFAQMDVPVFVIGYQGFTRRRGQVIRRIRMAIGSLREIAGILRREQAAILHAYLPAANVLGATAGLMARTPAVVVSKRGLCHYKKGRPILSFFENAANLATDAVLVNSDAVAAAVRSAERFCGRKIRLVYNGIDAASPETLGAAANSPPVPGLDPPLPPDAAPVLYVANLFPYKGHLDLVEAAASVAARFPNARFLLAGREEGAGAEVRSRIETLRLGEHVRLLGPRDDVPALMAAADLLVHPSHEEGFSNVILEAMAAGKAVVATAVGGIPEAVVDGETGILVPPRDPERLAGAVLSLLRDPERARAMGAVGRRRVLAHFPLKGMVREIEEMYEELLSGGRR